MFNPYDPRRVYIDPNPSSASISFPYTSATDSTQVPLGSRPEGNVLYVTPPFPSQVSGTPSASNSTTEFANSQLLGTHSASLKTGETSTAATMGAPATAASSVSLVNLMQPSQSPSNISYDPSRMSSNTTTSFSRYPAAQTVFSQPNTPLQATQTQILQQPLVLQAHSPSQAFTAQGAAATPPSRQRLMLISGPAPTTSMNPFYPYQTAAATGAAAAIQSGSSHHPPSTTTQLISPLQLTSPTSQGHAGSGNFAYVVESGSPAPLLAYSVSQPPFVSIASQHWPPAAAVTMLSSASETPWNRRVTTLDLFLLPQTRPWLTCRLCALVARRRRRAARRRACNLLPSVYVISLRQSRLEAACYRIYPSTLSFHHLPCPARGGASFRARSRVWRDVRHGALAELVW